MRAALPLAGAGIPAEGGARVGELRCAVTWALWMNLGARTAAPTAAAAFVFGSCGSITDAPWCSTAATGSPAADGPTLDLVAHHRQDAEEEASRL